MAPDEVRQVEQVRNTLRATDKLLDRLARKAPVGVIDDIVDIQYQVSMTIIDLDRLTGAVQQHGVETNP